MIIIFSLMFYLDSILKIEKVLNYLKILKKYMICLKIPLILISIMKCYVVFHVKIIIGHQQYLIVLVVENTVNLIQMVHHMEMELMLFKNN